MFLFKRFLELTIGKPGSKGIVISGLRIEFDIQKSSGSNSNTSKIRLFNPSRETIKEIQKKDAIFILKAGYSSEDQIKIISQGDITDYSIDKNKTDIIVELECSENGKKLNETKIDKSFQEGTKVKDILTELVDSIGLVSNITDKLENKTFNSGYSASGRVRDRLDEITQKIDAEWHIENNEVVVKSPNEPLQEEAFLLSYDTGLIEAKPQKKNDEELTSFRCLILPDLRIGKKIVISGSINELDGAYQVVKLTMRGDNRNGPFEILGEAKAL